MGRSSKSSGCRVSTHLREQKSSPMVRCCILRALDVGLCMYCIIWVDIPQGCSRNSPTYQAHKTLTIHPWAPKISTHFSIPNPLERITATYVRFIANGGVAWWGVNLCRPAAERILALLDYQQVSFGYSLDVAASWKATLVAGEYEPPCGSPLWSRHNIQVGAWTTIHDHVVPQLEGGPWKRTCIRQQGHGVWRGRLMVGWNWSGRKRILAGVYLRTVILWNLVVVVSFLVRYNLWCFWAVYCHRFFSCNRVA